MIKTGKGLLLIVLTTTAFWGGRYLCGEQKKAHIFYQETFKRWCCLYCETVTNQKHDCENHFKVAHRVTRWKCSACDKNCNDKWEIKMHQRKSGHYGLQEKFLCVECLKVKKKENTFNEEKSLYAHLKEKHPQRAGFYQWLVGDKDAESQEEAEVDIISFVSRS